MLRDTTHILPATPSVKVLQICQETEFSPFNRRQISLYPFGTALLTFLGLHYLELAQDVLCSCSNRVDICLIFSVEHSALPRTLDRRTLDGHDMSPAMFVQKRTKRSPTGIRKCYGIPSPLCE